MQEVLCDAAHLYQGGDEGRGEPLTVVQHCGTSLAMMQADYCGRLSLDRSLLGQPANKSLKRLVAGPGFEPGGADASKDFQLLSQQQIRGFGKRKIA